VAQSAVADQIDDHVLVKLVAVIQRQASDEDDRLRIISVDVEDRGLDHLGYVGAVDGRAGIQWITGGKADLVVEHYMDGTAGGEAAGLGQVERLHDDALAGEGRVAVDQQGQNQLAGIVPAAALAGPH